MSYDVQQLYEWSDEENDLGRVMSDGSIELVAGASLLQDGRYECMVFTDAKQRADIIAALQTVALTAGAE